MPCLSPLSQAGVGARYHRHALACTPRIAPCCLPVPHATVPTVRRARQPCLPALPTCPCSMGSPHVALFLRRHVSEKWKERHIASIVSLAGAWGGSLLAPLGLVAGTTGRGEEKVAARQALQQFLQALPVMPWLSPSVGVACCVCVCVSSGGADQAGGQWVLGPAADVPWVCLTPADEGQRALQPRPFWHLLHLTGAPGDDLVCPAHTALGVWRAPASD